MASPRQAGDVLPRPRILNVMGILNILVATLLMLFSVYLGWYAAFMPINNRALAQVRAIAEADLEAKRQAGLKAIDEAEKTASTASEKTELAARRKALEVPAKLTIPIGMDLEKLGMGGWKFVLYYGFDVATALVLDVLLLVAGIGMLRREMWGIRLGIAAAAGKIARLVLLYSFVIVAVIPPMAQGSGRVALEMAQQQKAMGAPMPPMMDAAFFTKLYFVTYTVMAVGMMLFGSIYPAIALWYLSRPGARAACEPRARHDQELSETRVLGIMNVVFASMLILFGLCLGTYLTALPAVGRLVTQIQVKAKAKADKDRKDAIKALEDDEAKATTESEKQALAEQRKALEARPTPPNPVARFDLGQLGFFDDSRIITYYWVELTSGLVLNVAMITAGIGLLRRKSWGVTLGIGTAAAKIIRLGLVYTYFALVLAPVLAEKSAAMMGKMIVQQQSILGGPTVAELDTGPLRQAFTSLFSPSAVGIIALGSIYPAISLWILIRARARAAADKTGPPPQELSETWS
jgi:hypothetical protein